jgi:hypothetical protein
VLAERTERRDFSAGQSAHDEVKYRHRWVASDWIKSRNFGLGDDEGLNQGLFTGDKEVQQRIAPA